MTIPIEFTVVGSPSSVNSTSDKKNIWQGLVKSVASGVVAAKYPGVSCYAGEVTVKIFYFPISQQYIDIDNGLKHTIDCLAPCIIQNDKTVTRIITERFPPVLKKSLVVPVTFAPQIAAALSIANGRTATGGFVQKQHATAVKVEVYNDNGGVFW